MNTMNKIVACCFVIFLITSVTVAGTLAYENWTAEKYTQEFNGNLRIKLVQRQRIYQDGTIVLTDMAEENAENKELIHLVGSAQYNGSNFDKYGMPVAEGYVDHIVQVKNTGTPNDAKAYVRVVVAIPAALDDANDAGKNALHWNLGNRFMQDGSFSSTNSTNPDFDDIDWKFAAKGTVEGTECNIYTFTYKTPLEPGETTPAAAFVGFYLDRDVDIVDGHITLDGEDTGFTSDSVKIYVKAQAVQAYGFDNAAEAFNAANASNNPWADGK